MTGRDEPVPTDDPMGMLSWLIEVQEELDCNFGELIALGRAAGYESLIDMRLAGQATGSSWTELLRPEGGAG